MKLTAITHRGVRAYLREGTSDRLIIKEVLSGEYRKLRFKPSDIVLDLGLNIGMFTIFALKKGIRKIYSYEPEQENFQLARLNIETNCGREKAKLFNAAVIGNDDPERPFSINLKKNKGLHSLVGKKGRDTVMVQCVNINTILRDIKPNIVKMDTEGGEYEILKSITDFSCIDQLILEFHHAHLNDIPGHKKYFEIVELLRKQFPFVHAREETKKAWIDLIYCHR
jgi:FkbM family methyltransferase